MKGSDELAEVIKSFWTENKYSPSIRELKALMNHKSVAHTRAVVMYLRELGVLEFEDGLARTIRLTSMEVNFS